MDPQHIPASFLPKRIKRLNELAYNLWWSWHPLARDLWRYLDYPLWRLTGHNPVRMLGELGQDRLEAVSRDTVFLEIYDSVLASFDSELKCEGCWYPSTYSSVLPGPVAYFSSEFAIHNSLPIYAGGLGILAGDTCKEASDIGLPFVGVGLMYPQGYFQQRISADGWQQEVYRQVDFEHSPISLVLDGDGKQVLVEVRADTRSVLVSAWLVRVGHTRLYLLDTNVDGNTTIDKQLTSRLYIADRELRIEQEMILGIGGVRLLRALGVEPSVWHANEGHTAFMGLERIREKVSKGSSFADALDSVRANTVFTTHTPIPAGTDIFPAELVRRYLYSYPGSLGADLETILKLGQDRWAENFFNMSVLALKTSFRCNAVSLLHGKVSRRMWLGLWPDFEEDKVPISHVTNGIHVPTWVGLEIDDLFKKYIARDWVKRHDEPDLWDAVSNIPDEVLWGIHNNLKQKLWGVLRARAQERWTGGDVTAAAQVIAMGAFLDPEVLTIGFVRRFTEYKRPALVFHDLDRLKKILTNLRRPVQIIFAGKSHPADFPGKHLLHQVYTLGQDPAFQGKIIFIEDHDLRMARYLTQGLDVWLNTPRRLEEACGTSGMKAALNGIPSLSVMSGWWTEGYNGHNGWAIRDGFGYTPDQDDADAQALYDLLEKEVAPLYYERDSQRIPRAWVKMMKETIRSIVPVFCTRRMLKEYTQRMYLSSPEPLVQKH